MIRKSIIFMALSCFAVCAYSIELNNSAFVNQWQNTGKKISSILNSINNQFSAEQAIPQLQKLTVKFNRLTTELASRQKADPIFASRYSSEAIFTLRKLKKALVKLNANDAIPFELREKIAKMLKKFKR